MVEHQIVGVLNAAADKLETTAVSRAPEGITPTALRQAASRVQATVQGLITAVDHYYNGAHEDWNKVVAEHRLAEADWHTALAQAHNLYAKVRDAFEKL